jgi:hypothetical protein
MMWYPPDSSPGDDVAVLLDQARGFLACVDATWRAPEGGESLAEADWHLPPYGRPRIAVRVRPPSGRPDPDQHPAHTYLTVDEWTRYGRWERRAFIGSGPPDQLVAVLEEPGLGDTVVHRFLHHTRFGPERFVERLEVVGEVVDPHELGLDHEILSARGWYRTLDGKKSIGWVWDGRRLRVRAEKFGIVSRDHHGWSVSFAGPRLDIWVEISDTITDYDFDLTEDEVVALLCNPSLVRHWTDQLHDGGTGR